MMKIVAGREFSTQRCCIESQHRVTMLRVFEGSSVKMLQHVAAKHCI